MPKSLKASATESKSMATAPSPREFDALTYHKEIVRVAYRIWLERAYLPGTPEEDWANAVREVRAKYGR